ncbi:MAG: hypothetical protein LBE24_10435 [Methylobacillus sp.]|jgi:hypothetical protein|nr:hypothetical protein [Methylobacillus sp.]
MMILRFGLVLALSFLLASCDNSPPPPAAAASAPASPDSVLKLGMAYADARQALLAQGWQPAPDPECRANVVGGGHETLCAAHPELDSCQICDAMPELSAASGDAHALMKFKRGDQILEVGAFGDISRWQTPGEEAELAVNGWEIVSPATAASGAADKAAAASCPSSDFNVFLRAFADDARIQQAFVADPLQYDSIDATAEPEPKPVTHMVPAKELQFPLMAEENGLKAQAPVVNGDQASVKLLKEDTSYQITYHFQQTGGCWRLVRIQNDSI